VKTVRARLFAVVVAVGAAVAITAAGSAAMAGDDNNRNFLHERLTGFQEDPLTISTPASAVFRAQIDEKAQTITYRLSYTGFPTAVTQAHIHFGGRAQSGGVSVFLCSNLGNGPAGTPACPASPGTVTGTLTAASVIGPAGQGIAPGEFAELVRAIHAGATYVNVHSTAFPGGEIRAQIQS
jgi:hypothetical protein